MNTRALGVQRSGSCSAAITRGGQAPQNWTPERRVVRGSLGRQRSLELRPGSPAPLPPTNRPHMERSVTPKLKEGSS